MKYSILLAAFLLTGFFIQPNLVAQISSSDVVGEWMTEDLDSKVTIYKEGAKYYGKVTWLEDLNDEDGQPFRDKENPDPKLRNQKILGLVVLKDFVFEGEEWKDGSIYDPKNGKTYKCYMSLEDPKKLKIRGYIGKSWMGLGRTTYWIK